MTWPNVKCQINIKEKFTYTECYLDFSTLFSKAKKQKAPILFFLIEV